MENEITDRYNISNKKYVAYLHEFNKEPFIGVADEDYQRIWTEPIINYMRIYDELDICLAPLAAIDFNQYKSNLKMLEAGAKKKPIIVSACEPYNQLGIHLKNALVIPSNKEHRLWIKYVNQLIDSASMREELGLQLYEDVKKQFDLDKTTELRAEIYKSF